MRRSVRLWDWELGHYCPADVISSYVYRQGIVQAQFSYSSAVGLFNSALNFIILLAANTASRRLSETSLF